MAHGLAIKIAKVATDGPVAYGPIALEQLMDAVIERTKEQIIDRLSKGDIGFLLMPEGYETLRDLEID